MSLTYLDVSGFDTSKVERMYQMFYNCMDLTSLDLSNFDTSNVNDMSSMFMYCSKLASLDLSGFDTSRVFNMYGMFTGCYNITQLSLGEGFFKKQSVTEVDFSDLENWSQDSFIQSVVTNSYDRTANGLANLTLKLHANTYAYLTDEHKATLTTKGYTVVSVE
jgi:surface protein